MFLADIAHVERALHRHFARCDGRGGDRVAAVLFQLFEHLLEGHEIELVETDEPGPHEVVAQIRKQHPEGREMPGRTRNDHPADTDFARNRGRVQRTGAAIGDQRETAGIESALGRHALDRIGHRGCGDAQNSIRRFGDAEPQRLRHPRRHGAFRGRDVELHLAAEKTIGSETAQQQIGVGDRRFGTATAVARRSRLGAGAARSDVHGVAVLDTRDRATAGADFENVDGRHLDRQRAIVAADQRMTGSQRAAIKNDAGLGGGAAHVEGDRVVHSERMTQRLRADNAGRRS